MPEGTVSFSPDEITLRNKFLDVASGNTVLSVAEETQLIATALNMFADRALTQPTDIRRVSIVSDPGTKTKLCKSVFKAVDRLLSGWKGRPRLFRMKPDSQQKLKVLASISGVDVATATQVHYLLTSRATMADVAVVYMAIGMSDFTVPLELLALGTKRSEPLRGMHNEALITNLKQALLFLMPGTKEGWLQTLNRYKYHIGFGVLAITAGVVGYQIHKNKNHKNKNNKLSQSEKAVQLYQPTAKALGPETAQVSTQFPSFSCHPLDSNSMPSIWMPVEDEEEEVLFLSLLKFQCVFNRITANKLYDKKYDGYDFRASVPLNIGDGAGSFMSSYSMTHTNAGSFPWFMSITNLDMLMILPINELFTHRIHGSSIGNSRRIFYENMPSILLNGKLAKNLFPQPERISNKSDVFLDSTHLATVKIIKFAMKHNMVRNTSTDFDLGILGPWDSSVLSILDAVGMQSESENYRTSIFSCLDENNDDIKRTHKYVELVMKAREKVNAKLWPSSKSIPESTQAIEMFLVYQAHHDFLKDLLVTMNDTSLYDLYMGDRKSDSDVRQPDENNDQDPGKAPVGQSWSSFLDPWTATTTDMDAETTRALESGRAKLHHMASFVNPWATSQWADYAVKYMGTNEIDVRSELARYLGLAKNIARVKKFLEIRVKVIEKLNDGRDDSGNAKSVQQCLVEAKETAAKNARGYNQTRLTPCLYHRYNEKTGERRERLRQAVGSQMLVQRSGESSQAVDELVQNLSDRGQTTFTKAMATMGRIFNSAQYGIENIQKERKLREILLKIVYILLPKFDPKKATYTDKPEKDAKQTFTAMATAYGIVKLSSLAIALPGPGTVVAGSAAVLILLLATTYCFMIQDGEGYYLSSARLKDYLKSSEAQANLKEYTQSAPLVLDEHTMDDITACDRFYSKLADAYDLYWSERGNPPMTLPLKERSAVTEMQDNLLSAASYGLEAMRSTGCRPSPPRSVRSSVGTISLFCSQYIPLLLHEDFVNKQNLQRIAWAVAAPGHTSDLWTRQAKFHNVISDFLSNTIDPFEEEDGVLERLPTETQSSTNSDKSIYWELGYDKKTKILNFAYGGNVEFDIPGSDVVQNQAFQARVGVKFIYGNSEEGHKLRDRYLDALVLKRSNGSPESHRDISQQRELLQPSDLLSEFRRILGQCNFVQFPDGANDEDPVVLPFVGYCAPKALDYLPTLQCLLRLRVLHDTQERPVDLSKLTFFRKSGTGQSTQVDIKRGVQGTGNVQNYVAKLEHLTTLPRVVAHGMCPFLGYSFNVQGRRTPGHKSSGVLVDRKKDNPDSDDSTNVVEVGSVISDLIDNKLFEGRATPGTDTVSDRALLHCLVPSGVHRDTKYLIAEIMSSLDDENSGLQELEFPMDDGHLDEYLRKIKMCELGFDAKSKDANRRLLDSLKTKWTKDAGGGEDQDMDFAGSKEKQSIGQKVEQEWNAINLFVEQVIIFAESYILTERVKENNLFCRRLIRPLALSVNRFWKYILKDHTINITTRYAIGGFCAFTTQDWWFMNDSRLNARERCYERFKDNRSELRECLDLSNVAVSMDHTTRQGSKGIYQTGSAKMDVQKILGTVASDKFDFQRQALQSEGELSIVPQSLYDQPEIDISNSIVGLHTRFTPLSLEVIEAIMLELKSLQLQSFVLTDKGVVDLITRLVNMSMGDNDGRDINLQLPRKQVRGTWKTFEMLMKIDEDRIHEINILKDVRDWKSSRLRWHDKSTTQARQVSKDQLPNQVLYPGSVVLIKARRQEIWKHVLEDKPLETPIKRPIERMWRNTIYTAEGGGRRGDIYNFEDVSKLFKKNIKAMFQNLITELFNSDILNLNARVQSFRNNFEKDYNIKFKDLNARKSTVGQDLLDYTVSILKLRGSDADENQLESIATDFLRDEYSIHGVVKSQDVSVFEHEFLKVRLNEYGHDLSGFLGFMLVTKHPTILVASETILNLDESWGKLNEGVEGQYWCNFSNPENQSIFAKFDEALDEPFDKVSAKLFDACQEVAKKGVQYYYKTKEGAVKGNKFGSKTVFMGLLPSGARMQVISKLRLKLLVRYIDTELAKYKDAIQSLVDDLQETTDGSLNDFSAEFSQWLPKDLEDMFKMFQDPNANDQQNNFNEQRLVDLITYFEKRRRQQKVSKAQKFAELIEKYEQEPKKRFRLDYMLIVVFVEAWQYFTILCLKRPIEANSTDVSCDLFDFKPGAFQFRPIDEADYVESSMSGLNCENSQCMYTMPWFAPVFEHATHTNMDWSKTADIGVVQSRAFFPSNRVGKTAWVKFLNRRAMKASAEETEHGCKCLPETYDGTNESQDHSERWKGCGPFGWCDVKPGCAGAQETEVGYSGWDNCRQPELTLTRTGDVNDSTVLEFSTRKGEGLYKQTLWYYNGWSKSANTKYEVSFMTTTKEKYNAVHKYEVTKVDQTRFVYNIDDPDSLVFVLTYNMEGRGMNRGTHGRIKYARVPYDVAIKTELGRQAWTVLRKQIDKSPLVMSATPSMRIVRQGLYKANFAFNYAKVSLNQSKQGVYTTRITTDWNEANKFFIDGKKYEDGQSKLCTPKTLRQFTDDQVCDNPDALTKFDWPLGSFWCSVCFSESFTASFSLLSTSLKTLSPDRMLQTIYVLFSVAVPQLTYSVTGKKARFWYVPYNKDNSVKKFFDNKVGFSFVSESSEEISMSAKLDDCVGGLLMLFGMLCRPLSINDKQGEFNFLSVLNVEDMNQRFGNRLATFTSREADGRFADTFATFNDNIVTLNAVKLRMVKTLRRVSRLCSFISSKVLRKTTSSAEKANSVYTDVAEEIFEEARKFVEDPQVLNLFDKIYGSKKSKVLTNQRLKWKPDKIFQRFNYTKKKKYTDLEKNHVDFLMGFLQCKRTSWSWFSKTLTKEELEGLGYKLIMPDFIQEE